MQFCRFGMQQATLLQYFAPKSSAQIVEQIPTVIPTEPNIYESKLLSNLKDNHDAIESQIFEEGQLVAVPKMPSRSDLFIPKQHPNMIITNVHSAHIARIQQLTSTLLPMKYQDKFFTESVTDSQIAQLCRVVLHNSKPVGWIRCRLESMNNNDCGLYIQALGILAPWRGLGLVTALLERVTQGEIIRENQVKLVFAHVWQNNEDALEWYEKRGFVRLRHEPLYYRRLRPPGAWVMQKQLG